MSKLCSLHEEYYRVKDGGSALAHMQFSINVCVSILSV